MAAFEHCHFCKPPVRHPGCQSHCPYYAADKAKCDERNKALKAYYVERDDYVAARNRRKK